MKPALVGLSLTPALMLLARGKTQSLQSALDDRRSNRFDIELYECAAKIFAETINKNATESAAAYFGI
jgi:hypothetical protein